MAAVPFALAAKRFADFEQAMAMVKSRTQSSGKEFESLENKAREMGKSTVFTATDAANAMAFFAMSGFSVKEILDAIEPTLNLAAAGQIGIAESADIAAKIMRAMGIEATDMIRVTDVLSKGMISANTDLQMLGDAFKFIAPAAADAGFSLEETTAAVAVLSDAGIQAEMAGTTLRNLLRSLTNPSAEAAAELDKLKFSAKDMETGSVKTFTKLMFDLSEALKDKDPFDRLQSLGTIFPARASGGASVTTKQVEKMIGLVDKLMNAEGTGARVAAVQLDTLTGSTKLLLSAVDDVAISLGKVLAPAIRSVAEFLTGFSNILGKLIAQNPAFFTTLAKGIVIAISVGAALILAGNALMFIGGIIGTVASAISGFVAALPVIAIVIGAIIGLWPFMIALGVAIAVVVANWDRLVRGFNNIVGTIKQVATSIADFLMQFKAVQDVMRGIGEFIQPWIDGWAHISFGFERAWGGIINAISAGDLELAWKIVLAALNLAWVVFTGSLEKNWLTARDAFLDAWDKAIAFFRALFGTQIDQVIGIFERLRSEWERVVGSMTSVWERFISVSQALWLNFSSVFRRVFAQMNAEATGGDATDAVEQVNAQAKSDAEQAKQGFEAALALADELSSASRNQRAKERAKAFQDIDDDIFKAQSDLQKLVEEARLKAAQAAAEAGQDGKGKGGGGGGPPPPKGLVPAGSVGTFSAAAASLLGLSAESAILEDQLEVQQKQLAFLDRIATNGVTLTNFFFS